MKMPFLRAIGLGFLLTIALGLMAHSRPQHSPMGWFLQKMEDGTEEQPFVRRQLVPIFLRAAHDVQPREWPHKENQWLESKRLLAPVLFDRDQGESLDSFECLVIWFFCFTVFAYTFESETSYYLQYARGVGSTSASTSILLTSLTCLIVVALLYNHNYFYDPVTIACAILAMRALRKEQLPALAVLTAIFAVNRETAFIVPGLTFFYWFHLRERKRALGQAALLSTIYLAITGIILFHYRHNPGHLPRIIGLSLIRMYLHQKLPFMVGGILALVAYGIAVARRWGPLPPALKAIQWFIPLWVAMHIAWGWPMEWRVFFEVYPGIMLTIATLWGFHRSGVRPRKLDFSIRSDGSPDTLDFMRQPTPSRSVKGLEGRSSWMRSSLKGHLPSRNRRCRC